MDYRPLPRAQGGPPRSHLLLSGYAYQLRALLARRPYIVEFMALRPITSKSVLRNYEHFSAELALFGATLMGNAPEMTLTPEGAREYPVLAQALQGPKPNPDDGFQLGFSAFIGTQDTAKDTEIHLV